MIAFKKMWDDVCSAVSNNELKNVNIVENFTSGFVVKDDKDTHFVTKDDFVDFWCNMLCFNEVDKEHILKAKSSGSKYVYEMVKTLPYVKENEGILKLTE